jgi:hypothetical protein
MYTFPVSLIVRKQQLPTRPEMDAIPDIIVIFAIFFSFLFMVIILFITPDLIRHLDSAFGCLPAGGSLHTSPQISRARPSVRAYPSI